MAGTTCDVCGKTAFSVCSSALGAISFAYCKECLRQNAEPLVAFETTAWTCGNEVAEFVRHMSTFVNGEYISWDDWYAKYGEACRERLDASYAEYERGRSND